MATLIKLSDVQAGRKNNSVLLVQKALAKIVGLDYSSGPGTFGPRTQAAYNRFRSEVLGMNRTDSTGAVGMQSLSALAARSGGLFTVSPNTSPSVPSTPSVPDVPASTGGLSATNYEDAPEPAMDMSRTSYGGRTVNQRTKVLLQRAATIYGGSFTLIQGSYNVGVAASAGTHDGGGVVDINVNGMSTANRLRAVQALRKAGFAAWLRTPDEGFDYHIHANAIGDREMKSVARNQVASYFSGRNGLVSNARVTDALHWPTWVERYM